MADGQTELMAQMRADEKAADTAHQHRRADEMLAEQQGCAACRESCPNGNLPETQSPLARQVGGDHYKCMPIQPVEFIHANNIPFVDGCIIKYVCRHRMKGGRADLEKARHFLDMLITMEYSDK